MKVVQAVVIVVIWKEFNRALIFEENRKKNRNEPSNTSPGTGASSG
jgi:hypothetical protein